MSTLISKAVPLPVYLLLASTQIEPASLPAASVPAVAIDAVLSVFARPTGMKATKVTTALVSTGGAADK